jgi:hypothetical protein
MQVNLRKPGRNSMTISGYMAPTVERAKAVADKEVAKYGHVCTEECKDWAEVRQIVPFSPDA